MQSITIQAPDDFHVHFRDEGLLAETVPATARVFHRAIAMPNLAVPLISVKDVMAYKQRIQRNIPTGFSFEPLMTLYLTEDMESEEIKHAVMKGIHAVKLYPSGVTTNSVKGVRDIHALYRIFEELSKNKVMLLIHGEVADKNVDIFDREREFIDRYLQQIVSEFPDLKVVFEHISTSEAVEFVLESGPNLAATVTPQHLLLNRNDLLTGGIRPHNYCLPILKRKKHQEALRSAVASGSKKFFLGTDSAPHVRSKKETACGCAGCYNAPVAIELYAQVFEELGVIEKLESFSSHYGADFYGLPRNSGKITLVKQPWVVPETIQLSNGAPIVPFMAGTTLNWKLETPL